MVCEKADVHEDGLVLRDGQSQSALVDRLPRHRCLGVKAHIWASAFAGAIPETRAVARLGLRISGAQANLLPLKL